MDALDEEIRQKTEKMASFYDDSVRAQEIIAEFFRRSTRSDENPRSARFRRSVSVVLGMMIPDHEEMHRRRELHGVPHTLGILESYFLEGEHQRDPLANVSYEGRVNPKPNLEGIESFVG